MKKLVIALASALLLTGCAQPAEPTAAPTESTASATELPTTQPTEAPAKQFYVPDSPMERSTGGAVQVYETDGSVSGLAVLGENLLVCTENRVLHLLGGEPLQEIRSRELEQELEWGSGALQMTDQGLAYYEEQTATYMTLDENLITGPSFVIAEKPLLRPVIASDLSAIYYATEEGIRTMDLQDGTSRLLRQEHGQIVELNGLYFENSVLSYTRLRSDGTEQTCFVSAETGSILRTNRFEGRMISQGAHFGSILRVEHGMGQENWVVLGNKYGQIKRLEPEEGWGNPILLPDGQILLQQRSALGLTLVCYDAASDRQVARIVMPQAYEPMAYAGVQDGVLWLSSGVGSRFYRWDMTAGEPGEPVARMRSYPSLGTPDEARLEQVRQQASALGDSWGVDLVFSQEDNRTTGGDYDECPDYRPDQAETALQRLQDAVERLPAGLLEQLGRGADSGRLSLVLTDRYDPLYPGVEASGSFSVEGGAARIEVSMCSDLEAVFYHELYHMMEVRIRNSGDGLDQWNSLNPEGFEYSGSEQPPETAELLPGENLFADGRAMESAREDRAQLFMYACMSGQQDRFASETMQKKLEFLSDLIRSTFHLEGEVLWEQYLPAEEAPPSP